MLRTDYFTIFPNNKARLGQHFGFLALIGVLSCPVRTRRGILPDNVRRRLGHVCVPTHNWSSELHLALLPSTARLDDTLIVD